MTVKDLLGLLGSLSYVIICCILTILIELFVLLFFKNKKKLFRPLLIANVITNPILNLILPSVYVACFFILNKVIDAYLIDYVILRIFEVVIVFSEAYIMKIFSDLKFKTCFKYSLVLNLVSFLLGIFANFAMFFIIMLL
ncbi:MAG: hypothetical protein J6R29_04500 [Clostridia bacterium]|nr:hypothetical protein [Clostridia bacterium]